MSSFTRARTFAGHVKAGQAMIVMAVALGATACSADFGRFDFPAMGFNSTSQQTTGSVPPPLPAAPMRQNAGVMPPPPPAPANQVAVAPLPGTSQRPIAAVPPIAPAPAPLAVAPAPAQPAPGSQTVEVKAGDSIYAIARRHHVSIAALMSANNLTNPTIRPGQRLVVPTTRRPVARTIARKTESPAAPVAMAPTGGPPAPKLVRTQTPTAAPEAAPADWTGTHTMQPGDSLYGIARRYRVPLARLQSVNGITEPTKIRPGVVLKVPASAVAKAPASPAPAPTVAPAGPRPAMKHAPAPSGTAPAKVTILNPGSTSHGAAAPKTNAPAAGDTPADAIVPPITGTPAAPGKRVASLGPAAKAASDQPATATDAAPAPGPLAATGTPKFRWPVKGRVIAGFGPRPNSSHNDGINISVQSGAEVVAAEAGQVAYAGSELKGYGNLVLIRHDGNWVTAYAHNDQILVKRGDRVRAGQPIAKAGRSGTVDQPQVHFEIRQGSRPVDPIPLLQKQ